MTTHAIIDIDNTLWPFWKVFYERLRSLNPAFPPPEHWSHFDIWEGYFSREDFFREIDAIHATQDNERHLPYPEARGFLSALQGHGYHIIIASHRLTESRVPTERWLDRYGLPYDELHLSFDKTTLFGPHARIVADDSPEVLDRAFAAGARCAGLIFPWNRAYAGRGYPLLKDLNEVLSYLLNG